MGWLSMRCGIPGPSGLDDKQQPVNAMRLVFSDKNKLAPCGQEDQRVELRTGNMNLRPKMERVKRGAVRQAEYSSDGIWMSFGRRTLLTAALATLAAFSLPKADAFIAPQGRTARSSSIHGYFRDDRLSTCSPSRILPGVCTPRSLVHMSSAVTKQSKLEVRRRMMARLATLVHGSGDRSRLGRLAHFVASAVRTAKRKAAKQALTVALAVTFALPSLNLPASMGGGASDGIGGGTGRGPVRVGANAAGAPVELVLPAEDRGVERSEQHQYTQVVKEVGGERRRFVPRAGRTHNGGLKRSAPGGPALKGRTAAVPSTTAFVGPWKSEEMAIQTKGGGAADIMDHESIVEAARSLVVALADNGLEIAEEFGHHLKGAKRDVLVILLANALIIPVCKRVSLSPVLGFLAAGVVLGPNCLSIVSDVKAIEVLGEMGIVFFLFEMGLELSVSRLMAMKRDVFGMGLATFGVSAAAVAGVGYMAGLTGAQMIVIGGGVALSSSAFVLQLLRDRDDLGTRYGRACFGILLFQDLAVVPLLVAIPLLAGGGAGVAAALTSAATKAGIALGLIALIGKTVLNRFFLLVAKSKSQEAFLAVILLTVIALSTITEGLGLSGTLGAFLAGTLLSETKYTPQVEADIAPFRALLLGMFFMTVGFEIDLTLCFNNLPLVASLVSGLLAMKAAIIAIISLAFGLSVANAQQTGLLLSQGGEFAFVAFGMATSLGIIKPQMCKLLLTTVALSMAATPALSNFSAWVADQMERRMGYDHYVGADSESDEIRQGGEFVVVCGYGRIGKLVCELLGKMFINFVAFDNNPLKAMEARNRGLPVFYGDVFRPEVLNAFNVGKAKAVICTLSDIKGTNKAVVNLRREFPELPIFARAKDSKHQKRLTSIMDVVAMVPTLPEDSIIVSLPFGGAVLRSLGCSSDEVNVLLEETRKKFVMEKGLENEEDDNLFEQLGLSRSAVQGYKDAAADGASVDGDNVEIIDATVASSQIAAVTGVTAAVDPGSGADVEVEHDIVGDRASSAAATVSSIVESSTAGDAQGGSRLAEDEESLANAKAAAAAEAAAALEAAVASGDVMYPSNPDKDDMEGDADAADKDDNMALVEDFLDAEEVRADQKVEEEELFASLNTDATPAE